MQALAGILLPSTIVLLLILSNDEQLLGPFTNRRSQNVTAGAIVAAVLTLSTTLTITTALPHLDLWIALLATCALLLAGTIAVAARIAPGRRRQPPSLNAPSSHSGDVISRPRADAAQA